MKGAVVFRREVPLWLADWLFRDVQQRVTDRARVLSTEGRDPFGVTGEHDEQIVEIVVAVGVTPELGTSLAARWEAVARNCGMVDPEMFRRQCAAHGIRLDGAA